MSKESQQAFAETAAVVFCVTFFWAHGSPERYRSREPMAQAAKSAGVLHVIWSTRNTAIDFRSRILWMPTLHRRVQGAHFDARAKRIRCSAARIRRPSVWPLTSFYWDNLIHFGMGPKQGPDGTLAFTLPMGEARLPGIAAEDIGKCVLGLMKKRDAYLGTTVGIAGEHLTGSQMAVALTKAFGREVRYNAVSPEVYRTFGFPGADELGNMFQFKRDFNAAFCGARNPVIARTLNPSLQTFAQWLEGNKNQIPLS
ncbi:MAG: NmrA family NAD(P)-binding protein [Nitrospira sp.]|nr:NmrA family NAD(P)-binding protein [Nitrospira sp.]